MPSETMIQFVLTPAAGKRLIARAVARHPAVMTALREGTVAVIAGTTNGYVAEELLRAIGQAEGFQRQGFFRGVVMPPLAARPVGAAAADKGHFPGDVIIRNGEWQQGRTIFDVIDELREGDVIVKGANALDLARKEAGVLIGDPKGGTIGASLPAVIGHGVRLIIPVGLEKRVAAGLPELVSLLNAPGSLGPRLLPVPGEVISEIEALALLAQVRAELMAAGGVAGAEGAIRLAISGSDQQLAEAKALLDSVAAEPPFPGPATP